MNLLYSSFNKLDSEQRLTLVVNYIGILLYAAFLMLDFIVYPDFFIELLAIRTTVLAWLITMSILYLFQKIDSILPFSILFPAAIGISLMCYVTEEGFASIYFVGNLIIIVFSAIFIKMETAKYAFLMLFIVLQHFLLQFLLPFYKEDLFINIFFLVSAIFLAITINIAMKNMTEEIKTLRGLLPICMYCKKIRTDAGAWHKIELYISQRADVNFSHGICPACMPRSFQEDDEDLKAR